MGNTLARPSSFPNPLTTSLDSYVSELPDIVYEKSMGTSRFMKTIKCHHKEGPIVVKIFIKPEIGGNGYLEEESLEKDLGPFIEAMNSRFESQNQSQSQNVSRSNEERKNNTGNETQVETEGTYSQTSAKNSRLPAIESIDLESERNGNSLPFNHPSSSSHETSGYYDTSSRITNPARNIDSEETWSRPGNSSKSDTKGGISKGEPVSLGRHQGLRKWVRDLKGN